MTASKILVTGATGTIGSQLIKLLQESNENYVAMVRNEDSATVLREQGIPNVYGDFEDESSLIMAMKGIDKLFLLTPPSLNQAEYKMRAIKAAQINKLTKIISISVIGASEESSIQLGKMHGLADRTLINSGIAYTILRPHSFMQNFIGSKETIKQGQLYGATGNAKIPYVDTRDIASVSYSLLLNEQNDNQILEITGPSAVSGNDVASAFSDSLNQDVNYINIPFEALNQALISAGFPNWLADDLVELNKIWAEGYGTEVSDTTASILGHPGNNIVDFTRDYSAFFSE